MYHIDLNGEITLKIGWILKADKKNSSSRMHGFNIHNYLLEHGQESILLRAPAIMNKFLDFDFAEIRKIMNEKFDILIFLVSEGDAGFLNYLQLKSGGKTCLIVCDLWEFSLYSQADTVITPSKFLKKKLKKRVLKNIFVIEDALEFDCGLCKKNYSQTQNKISLVWFGHPDNLHLLEPIKQILKETDFENFELITITDSPKATIQWDKNNLHKNWEKVMECDIAVFPSKDTDWYMSKSNNKLTTAMALGLPVVAYPIPAYQGIMNHKKNVFSAKTLSEWKKGLSYLMSKKNRERLGTTGRENTINIFSLENIGKQWEEVLNHIYSDSNVILPKIKFKIRLKYYIFKLYYYWNNILDIYFNKS